MYWFYFPGSLSIFFGLDWKFPGTINALMGSCVEIPCTYPPPKNMGAASVAWYRLHLNYMHVFDSRADSLVEKHYQSRTSLVPGKNSCTLRIDPVRKEDRTSYYPGLAERPQDNAFSQGLRFVWLGVTGRLFIFLFRKCISENIKNGLHAEGVSVRVFVVILTRKIYVNFLY